MVLQLEEHKITSSAFSSVTFSKFASSEMAPLFHLLVYCFYEENSSILSDVVTVPVNGFSRYEVIYSLLDNYFHLYLLLHDTKADFVWFL